MNKLLLLVVIVVFLVVGGLIVNLGSDDESAPVQQASTEQSSSMGSDATEQAPLTEAERDSYVNTIQTINARYRDLEQRFSELVGEQEKVAKVMPTDEEIDRTVDQRVASKTNRLARDFEERLNAIKADLEQRMSAQGNASGSGGTGGSSSIPAGLGFDHLVKDNAAGQGTVSPAVSSGWSTVLPMGDVDSSQEDGGNGRPGGLLGLYSQATKQGVAGAVRPAVQQSVTAQGGGKDAALDDEEEDPIPVYTIPRNATLFSNDTLTALLGVIPVEGSILDPIRFKLITGAPNLATNGLYIPGIKNIVWSGIAIGNREMSCVRGELYSVTFVFEDGTIRTVSSDNNRAVSDTKQRSKRILGYISDRQGSPCIRGELITNAQDYLKDRMIASGAAATASAFGTTQEAVKSNSDGSTVSYFRPDGNTGAYIGSKALAGTLTELSQYLAERSRNAVDLVFVEAGQQVVLHVEHQIEIDYDPNGRKLEYENSLSLAARGADLD